MASDHRLITFRPPGYRPDPCAPELPCLGLDLPSVPADLDPGSAYAQVHAALVAWAATAQDLNASRGQDAWDKVADTLPRRRAHLDAAVPLVARLRETVVAIGPAAAQAYREATDLAAATPYAQQTRAMQCRLEQLDETHTKIVGLLNHGLAKAERRVQGALQAWP